MSMILWILGICFVGGIVGLLLRLIWILIGRRLWGSLLTLFVLLGLATGAVAMYHHHIESAADKAISVGQAVGETAEKNKSSFQRFWDNTGIPQMLRGWRDNNDQGNNDHPSSSVATAQDRTTLKQLMKYTNASSAGPNQDYYWKNGNAQLADDSDVKVGQLKFSDDSAGRAGIARGKLTYSMFAESKGGRQGTPLDPPNGGWPSYNPKVALSFGLTNRIYHGYMYNRSHSIADSLGGAASYASADNFTAGTRSQNVGADQHGGMRAAEEIAENYWRSHPNSSTVIEYQTTPIYHGNEKIPRGSIVNEKSSDGQINEQIVVINSAEGYTINYNTGAINRKQAKSTRHFRKWRRHNTGTIEHEHAKSTWHFRNATRHFRK